MLENAVEVIGAIILALILAVVMAAVVAFIVMLLWNWLMPEIFGLPEIGYLQAAGLTFLARIFFGSEVSLR